jgi:predicted DNA binding protein
MTLCEARLEVTFDSAFSDLTKKFPKSAIMIWCNAQTHLYEFHAGNQEELALLKEEAEKLVTQSSFIQNSQSFRFLSTSCDCGSENVSTILQDEQCWYVQPLIFENGMAHYRVICPDRDSIERQLRRLIGMNTK